MTPDSVQSQKKCFITYSANQPGIGNHLDNRGIDLMQCPGRHGVRPTDYRQVFLVNVYFADSHGFGSGGGYCAVTIVGIDAQLKFRNK